MSDTLRWATELDASGFASGAQRVNSSLGEMGFRTSAAQMNLGGLGTMLYGLANPLTLVAAGAMAVGAAFVGSVQAAAAWQSSMAGVSKTTGLTGQDLSNLSKELLDMSTRMPAAASEIANVAQVAGSLGIGQEFAAIGDFGAQAEVIAEFTEVAIQMGVGFEMSAEQAATAGAKILTAFKLDTTAENMNKLGSVVNAMGDSFAATEPQVLDFLNRASFLNTTMGQTIPQIAALGTVLISTGLDADTAATGLKSFLNIATSETSRKGGLDNWAKLMNISVEELKANLAGDFNSTLIETANQIAAIEDPVERFQKAVALAGTEGAPALLKLAGQQENLQKALGLTNEEWEKAQSLQKTYAAQSDTFNSQMQIFWNVLNMAGTELGTVMLPALTESVKQATAFALALIDVGEALSDITNIGGEGGVSARVYDLTGGMLGMTAEQQNLMAEARKKAQEASIGAEMAKEIEENERLQKAGAEAIQVGIDKGVFKDAGAAIGKELGKNAADEFGNEFIAQANFANLGSLAMLDMINSQTTKANEQVATSFEHMGQKYEMLVSKGGSLNTWHLFSGGELVGSTRQENNLVDPVKAFEAITGFPAPEKGTKDYFLLLGDYINAEKTKLQEAITGPSISLWDDPNNQRSWDKFIGENTDLAKQAGDLIIYELYNAQNAALASGDKTLQESFGNVMKGLADPGSVPANVFNQSLADIIDAGYVSDGHRAAMQEIAEKDAETYKSAIFGTMKGSVEKRSIAEMRASGWAGIEDFTAWSKNEYQPTLKSEISEMNELWDKGYGANRATAREYLEGMKKDHEEHSEWFEDWQNHYIDLLQSGVLNEDQFFDAWENMAGKADEKAATALDEIKSANAMFYGEFLSDNAQWQSYVNENGGYVGPTKLYGGYRDAMDAEIAAAQEVNQKYGIATVGSIGMVAELDTTEALTATEALVADINAMAPDMVLTLDINSAQMAWLNFFADIETINPTMHVNVEIDANAQEIAAMVEAAIVEALA